MLQENQYKELEKLGMDGIPLEHCGARLEMTRDEFIDIYKSDRRARLSYEKGQSIGAEVEITSIKTRSNKDWKAQEYLATNIFKLKIDPKKKEIEPEKKEKTDSIWFDEDID